MINHNDPFDQLPNEIKLGFKELNVPKHLAGQTGTHFFQWISAYLAR